MNNFEKIDTERLGWHVTFKSYVLGFILSIVLTSASYLCVVKKGFTGLTLHMAIVGFAVIQMIAQLIFFLHLGKGAKLKWNLVLFFYMILALVIFVFGSLWIMYNLDERVMPKM